MWNITNCCFKNNKFIWIVVAVIDPARAPWDFSYQSWTLVNLGLAVRVRSNRDCMSCHGRIDRLNTVVRTSGGGGGWKEGGWQQEAEGSLCTRRLINSLRRREKAFHYRADIEMQHAEQRADKHRSYSSPSDITFLYFTSRDHVIRWISFYFVQSI